MSSFKARVIYLNNCFVYLRDILEEVAELTGLALQEDSCFDYWVVDDAATSSTHSTPCLASCRYDQLAAFTAATDSSDKVLGLTGFVLDNDSLPAEATITLRVYEHIKARLPFVNITTRPQGRVDAPVPSGAPSASKHDLLVREKREASPSNRISGNLRPNTEPYSTDDKLVNSEDHANLPTYSEGRTTMTDLMLEAYPQEIVLDPWRPNGTWGDVLIVRMDPGSSGGLSHMWAFSASSSRTDSKGRWKGPRLDANVEYSKYSKRRCMGVFVCCDQSCPGKRRPHTSLSTASRSKLFQEETPQLVTGRPKKAATRKHLAPNVERPSDELPPCPITSCNGPMRHILCSATIARGQREECPGEIYIWHSGYHLHPPPPVSRPSPQHLEELRQLRKAAPQASAAELRMGQMTAFPQDPRHRPSASEICPVFDSTRSISRYAPRVGHSKRNGALPDTLMSAIEAVANAGCLAYIEIPGQRQGQPLAEQIHDPDPRKQPRNDGSRATSFGIQTPQMKARLSETIEDRLVEGNSGWPTDAHNTYIRDNRVLLATVCYSPSARRWFPILYSVGNHERSGFYRRHFAHLFQILDDANYSVEDIVNGVTFVVAYSSAQISGLRQAISDWYVVLESLLQQVMSSTGESDFPNGSGNRLYLKDTQGYKSWSQCAFINLRADKVWDVVNQSIDSLVADYRSTLVIAHATALTSVQVADKVAEYRERAIRRSDLACKYIANSISEEQMSHLIHLTSAYEMWDTLRGLHSHGRPSRTMDLLNTLAQPYSGDIPFKEFVNKVKIALTDFQNLGAPLPHWLFAGMLVRSLPAQYDSIVGNLASDIDIHMDWNTFYPKLLMNVEMADSRNKQKELLSARIVDNTSLVARISTTAQKDYSKSDCSRCKALGHERGWRLCPSRNKDASAPASSDSNSNVAAIGVDESALMTYTFPYSRTMPRFPWIIDSGAKVHCVGDKSVLSDVVSEPLKISVADQS
ncbi:BQ5605_C011g06269 [Microbotryum silenes-dioicae]|uniref:BQ5605_C011g06269 protein n=1 Tax=Microbotryum silenes-dioicae TaxID=796604 RepID=A0A2X0NSF7_9BASI|nr:BQ5605_C011g06269 [Microbotryum silenes-dioicae]